jgi:hypothetical protein
MVNGINTLNPFPDHLFENNRINRLLVNNEVDFLSIIQFLRQTIKTTKTLVLIHDVSLILHLNNVIIIS